MLTSLKTSSPYKQSRSPRTLRAKAPFRPLRRQSEAIAQPTPHFPYAVQHQYVENGVIVTDESRLESLLDAYDLVDASAFLKSVAVDRTQAPWDVQRFQHCRLTHRPVTVGLKRILWNPAQYLIYFLPSGRPEDMALDPILKSELTLRSAQIRTAFACPPAIHAINFLAGLPLPSASQANDRDFSFVAPLQTVLTKALGEYGAHAADIAKSVYGSYWPGANTAEVNRLYETNGFTLALEIQLCNMLRFKFKAIQKFQDAAGRMHFQRVPVYELNELQRFREFEERLQEAIAVLQ